MASPDSYGFFLKRLQQLTSDSKAVQHAAECPFVEVEGTKREGQMFFLTEMGRLFLDGRT